MPSEFNKLYRELSRKTVDTTDLDLSYKKERLDLLQRIGYKTSRQNTEFVQPSSYHGKVVRIKRAEADQWKQNGVIKSKYDTKIKINSVISEADELTKVTDAISDTMRVKGIVTESLITKLSCVSPRRSSYVVNTEQRTPIHQLDDKLLVRNNSLPSLNLTGRRTSTVSQNRNSKTVHQPIISGTVSKLNEPFTYKATPNTIRRDYTKQKWSLEERNRINAIYWEIPMPKPKNNKELWKLYFLNFATMFQSFYPKRSTQEVVEKVRDMIARRQMKEKGETEYWQNNVSSNAINDDS